jgi:hypothetical protein
VIFHSFQLSASSISCQFSREYGKPEKLIEVSLNLEVLYRNLVKVQLKGKFVPVLNKRHALNVYGEWRYSSTHFLFSALDGVEGSISYTGR